MSSKKKLNMTRWSRQCFLFVVVFMLTVTLSHAAQPIFDDWECEPKWVQEPNMIDGYDVESYYCA